MSFAKGGKIYPVLETLIPRRRRGPAKAALSLVSIRESSAQAWKLAGRDTPRRPLWPLGASVGLLVLAGLWLVVGPSAGARLHLPTEAPRADARSASPAAPVAVPAQKPAGQGVASGPVDASRFAPGACIAFAPTGADRHQTVFLDAGHGGPDPGALGLTQSGRALRESDLTLATVLATVPVLQHLGYRVVASRTQGSAVARIQPGDLTSGVYTATGAENDLRARGVCANQANAAVLVGVHFNAGGSPADAGMLTVYDELRTFSAKNLRLATLLQTRVLAALNSKGWAIPDGGVIKDAEAGGPGLTDASRAYGRLMILGPAAAGFQPTPSAMPGAVAEPLFLTDPFEGSIAADAAGQQAMATGIAQAVDTFLSPG